MKSSSSVFHLRFLAYINTDEKKNIDLDWCWVRVSAFRGPATQEHLQKATARIYLHLLYCREKLDFSFSSIIVYIFLRSGGEIKERERERKERRRI